MLLYPLFKGRKMTIEADGGLASCGCCLGILLVVILSVSLKAAIVLFTWNYVIVGMLELTATTITFWQALVIGILLSFITG